MNSPATVRSCHESPEPGELANNPSHSLSASGRFFPLLSLLFFGSGCAALVYEIVWFHMLQLTVGSTAISLGVLLGTFMGGMCLGSIALPRLVSRSIHPLRVWACLEAGIGLLGLLVLVMVPFVSRFYAANALEGLPGLLLRAVVCAACLLPPTFLMGATLPAISRWVETTPEGVSRLGFFYGGNTVGAVFGCLLAGFYLLRLHDVVVATAVAAAINGTIASVGFLLASRAAWQPAAEPLAKAAKVEEAGAAHLAIALSGLCALGAEVVWTRQLSLLLGGTVYVFSIILAVFLAGLGLGSAGGALLARRTSCPRVLLGVCQMLLTAAMAWSAFMLGRSLPFWPINPALSQNEWFTFQVDVARCLWVVLPAAMLWGASFPLALAAAAKPGQDPGRLVGRMYAANTAGAITGSVVCSVLLIGWIGTQQTQRVLILIAALSGLLMLFPTVWSQGGAAADSGRPRLRSGRAALLLAAVLLAVCLGKTVPQTPWQLVAYGRNTVTEPNPGALMYLGEGMNSSVAVTASGGGVRNFHVSGKIEASTEPQDMRLQRMLGHIPALCHSGPRSVLVVGCGAGVTAGSFIVHPEVERIVVCEIEPLIPRAVAGFFDDENHHLLSDPRVTVVFDDARHYLLRTREKFDVITSDPIHPWVKGAASLYTKEYFELCKQHLNPGGQITQWVPLYESTPAAVKSEFATFFAVFPEATVWNNDRSGAGYDVVLLGSAEPLKIDLAQLEQRLARPDHQRVVQSLRDVNFSSGLALLLTYAGSAPDLAPWLKDAQLNRDRDLRLQYLAGLGLNRYEEGKICSEFMSYRRFPMESFIGTNLWSATLHETFDSPK